MNSVEKFRDMVRRGELTPQEERLYKFLWGRAFEAGNCMARKWVMMNNKIPTPEDVDKFMVEEYNRSVTAEVFEGMEYFKIPIDMKSIRKWTGTYYELILEFFDGYKKKPDQYSLYSLSRWIYRRNP